MIKELSLTNFKSFEHLGNLEIKPLTILVGKNSCGKSTILQSLLLLKQTLESRMQDDALCLDGNYLKYSNLKEICHNLPPVNNAQLKYEFKIENSGKSLGTIAIEFKNKRKREKFYDIVVNNIILKNIDDTVIFDSNSISLEDIKRELPDRIKKSNFSSINLEYFHFLPKYFEIKLNKKDKTKVMFPVQFVSKELFDICSELNSTLKNMKYLNPVRAIPQRAYLHYSQNDTELLEDGSNSAHILWQMQKEKVIWQGISIPLIDAVNSAISCMGLSQKIAPERIGDVLYKLNVSIFNQKNVTIADVGFGYSQLLPIVLRCLLLKKNNLALIEQPEIHLHPSSAGNLADFFIKSIIDSKYLIVETHSQELINRLRLNVIKNPELRDKINIVFVTNDEGGRSQIKQFSIDNKGFFPEWPDGFLDESQKIANEILNARLKK